MTKHIKTKIDDFLNEAKKPGRNYPNLPNLVPVTASKDVEPLRKAVGDRVIKVADQRKVINDMGYVWIIWADNAMCGIADEFYDHRETQTRLDKSLKSAKHVYAFLQKDFDYDNEEGVYLFKSDKELRPFLDDLIKSVKSGKKDSIIWDSVDWDQASNSDSGGDETSSEK